MEELQALQQRREEILETIGQLGDMRRGSVTEQYLKVPLRGKKEPVQRGPYYVYSCKVKGKTNSRRVRGPEVDRLQPGGAPHDRPGGRQGARRGEARQRNHFFFDRS